MGLTVASKTLWGSIFCFIINWGGIWTKGANWTKGGARKEVSDRSDGVGQVGGVKWVIGKEREKNQPRAVYVLRGADSKGIYCY